METDAQVEAETKAQKEAEAEEQAGIAEADVHYEVGRKSFYGLGGLRFPLPAL